MCGPDAHFSEKFKDSIELVDDDPDAVEAVLRYLYDGDVSPKRPADWLHQLHLAKAADKVRRMDRLTHASADCPYHSIF